MLATIANGRTEDSLAEAGGAASAQAEALTDGFQAALAGGAGFALLGLLLAAVLISSADSRRFARGEGDAEGAPVAI